MAVKLEIINPANYPGWDDLMLASPGSTFFHTSTWTRVLAESYQYNAACFTLFDREQLLAAVPVMEIKSALTGSRGVSLPFSDYCTPILNDESRLPEVMASICNHGKNAGWKYWEFRSGKNFHQNLAPCSYYYAHTLNLARQEEEILAGFRDSTRGNIRKAVKDGVTVDLCNTWEAVNEFYRLNCLTRKRHGLPPQPRYFFKKIFDHIIARGLGFVALAAYKNKNIAGAVYFHFGKKALCKYAASDRAYQNLRAGNLVIWQAIRWYSQRGYENFCFGRTDPTNQGLRQFKNGWGAREEIINYFKYDFKKGAFSRHCLDVSSTCHKILQKMPIRLLKIIGSLAYKHIG